VLSWVSTPLHPHRQYYLPAPMEVRTCESHITSHGPHYLRRVDAVSDLGFRNRVEACDSRDATMMRQTQVDEERSFVDCRMVSRVQNPL
jgi:hypothetical protein